MTEDHGIPFIFSSIFFFEEKTAFKDNFWTRNQFCVKLENSDSGKVFQNGIYHQQQTKTNHMSQHNVESFIIYNQTDNMKQETFSHV